MYSHRFRSLSYFSILYTGPHDETARLPFMFDVALASQILLSSPLLVIGSEVSHIAVLVYTLRNKKGWPTVHVVRRLRVRVVNQGMVHVLEVVAYPVTEPHLLYTISVSEAQL